MDHSKEVKKRLFEALHSAYLDACKNKDYRLCDLIRQEIQRVVSDSKMLIPCEKELALTPEIPEA